MADTPTCLRCGKAMAPVWCLDAHRLRAWLCACCGHFEAPIGRECQITQDDWDQEEP